MSCKRCGGGLASTTISRVRVADADVDMIEERVTLCNVCRQRGLKESAAARIDRGAGRDVPK